MFLTEFDEEKMKRQEREEGHEEEQWAVEEALQLFIKTGRICKEDADDFRSLVSDKRREAGIV